MKKLMTILLTGIIALSVYTIETNAATWRHIGTDLVPFTDFDMYSPTITSASRFSMDGGEVSLTVKDHHVIRRNGIAPLMKIGVYAYANGNKNQRVLMASFTYNPSTMTTKTFKFNVPVTAPKTSRGNVAMFATYHSSYKGDVFVNWKD